MIKQDKYKIRPFNKIYLISLLVFVILTYLMCNYLHISDDLRAYKLTKSFSIFTFIVMLIYRFLLMFDKEYADIVYNGKMNYLNELIIYPCNIVVIAYVLAFVLNNRLLYSFAFYYSICPIAAILFPAKGFEDDYLFKPRIFAYYFSHYLIMMEAFFVVASRVYIPTYKDLIGAVLLYCLISFIALLINYVMIKTATNPEANYFFNMRPDGNGILEFFYKLIPIPYLFTLPLVILFIPINALMCFIANLF